MKITHFLRFIFTKQFWKHLFIIAVVFSTLVFSTIIYLSFYTQHGEEFPMPQLVGENLYDLELGNKFPDLQYVVVDSIYEDPSNAGQIVMQNPISGSMVKKGRKVYITIVASNAEMTIMPDLRDLTLRNALNRLKINKLTLGEVIYKPSFAANAVLKQLYKNDTISIGDTLVVGSIIDLEVGKGEGRMELNVPNLYGKTKEEAIDYLTKASFNIGQITIIDTVEVDEVLVFEQSPNPFEEGTHREGDSIHLWFRSPKHFDFTTYLDSLARVDSLNTIIKQQFEEQEIEETF